MTQEEDLTIENEVTVEPSSEVYESQTELEEEEEELESEIIAIYEKPEEESSFVEE